jgi:RHS repeat-associated protein
MGRRRLKSIKDAGGLVFAQEFQTARQPDMPQSAVKTGCVDRLLSPTEIAAQLGRIGAERARFKERIQGYPLTLGYDAVGNLVSLTDANGHMTKWSYTDRNQVQTKTYADNTACTYSYDLAGRLQTRLDQLGQTTTYGYNAYNLVSSVTYLDHQRSFSYDAQRQLIQSTTTANGVQTAMPQYTYDGIGNRLTSAINDSNGAQASSYTPNSVNQYTAITGALADAPSYDGNGNTTSVAGETLSYDQENRLVQIADSTHQSVFVYDGLGRRVERQEYAGGSQTAVIHYVYDGRNVIEDLGSSYATLRSYIRGLDLSGSFAGAGGIGGLLALSQPAASGPGFTTASYFYDGNGNVTDLISDDGTSAAHYVYSPFGYRVSATGSLADVNPYQFSSKERDSFTGFYYYGLRYYNPAQGRWLNRDPIRENGGLNLYGFVANNPQAAIDSDGLKLETYSKDPANIPLTPDTEPPDNPKELGEAGVHWNVGISIESDDVTVTINGGISFTPHVYPMDALFPGHKDFTGRTTPEHEHHHDQIAKEAWNEGIRFLNMLEGKYCSPECAQKAAAIADKINRLLQDRMEIRQTDFDMDAYGRYPDGNYTEPGQKVLSDRGGAVNRAEFRLNEERALMKKFIDMKCVTIQ